MVEYWVVAAVGMGSFLIGIILMSIFALGKENDLYKQIASLHGRITDMVIANSRRGK